MLIRVGYDIRFELAQDVAFVALLRAHPSRQGDLQMPDTIRIEPDLPMREYTDSFGNLCGLFLGKAGPLRLWCESTVLDSGEPDLSAVGQCETPVNELPTDKLLYLLSSRYCEVDLLSSIALELFHSTPPGGARVQAVCDWVHSHVVFDYTKTRATKTALDVYTERVGVCRDFQHLAITFCRALNIPARYVTGYLGEFGVPRTGSPMDFSAWFEVWLGGQWWTFDARNNRPRIGRVLMATGRDAGDVAMTTSFGAAQLTWFSVTSDEIREDV